MYSFCNKSIRDEFIRKELEKPQLQFVDEIGDAFSSVIAWLSTIAGVGEEFVNHKPKSLDSQEPIDIAREFSSLFPSHSLKVYKLLLEFENKISEQNSPIIMDLPNLAIVDVGCGGGAFSIAVINFLLQYMQFRNDQGYPISKVRIDSIGIEPKSFALDLFSKNLTTVKDLLDPKVFELNFFVLPGTFVENSDQVLRTLMYCQSKYQTVIFGMSNMIRPFTRRNNDLQIIKSNFYLAAKFLPPWWMQSYREQIQVMETVLNSNMVDQICIPVIGSKSENPETKEKKIWLDEIREFQGSLHQQISYKHKVSNVLSEYIKFDLILPKDGYWRKIRKKDIFKDVEFATGCTFIKTQDFLEDTFWKEVLDFENLMLAWARARNEINFGMFEDTLELRLFEANIEDRIRKIQLELKNYLWEALHVRDMLNYKTTKGEGKQPRPLSLGRIEDQILSVAVIQLLEKEMEISHPKSYAYKLKKNNKELLYEPFYETFSKFQRDARSFAKKHTDYNVIKTDLKSYYTSINQEKLMSLLIRYSSIENSRSRELIAQLIYRNCEVEREGFGIPQGHIWSGLLSNLYLLGVDKKFDDHNEFKLRYFRYVDDMIFIVPSDIDPDLILSELDDLLISLDLERSEEKTKLISVEELLDETADDDVLDGLGRQHNYLLSKLYKLDKKMLKLFRPNKLEFIQWYQFLLTSLGIYIHKPRLLRKLGQYDGWWKRIKNPSQWKYRIRFPEVEGISGIDQNTWIEEFHAKNPSWNYEYETHKKELTELLLDSIANLKNDIHPLRSIRRIKFSVYRLSQIGFDHLSNEIVALLVENPELFQHRPITLSFALQGLNVKLLNLHDLLSEKEGEEYSYNKAVVLKALQELSDINQYVEDRILKESIDAESIVEKTMATESAFFTGLSNRYDLIKLKKSTEACEEAYLAKNYLLNLKRTNPNIEINLKNLGHRVIHEAQEFSRVRTDLSELFRFEPDVLYDNYYEANYPDNDNEFPEPPSQYV